MGEGGMKENDGGGEFKYEIFDIRTFKMPRCTPTHHNNIIF
jgi:hypothetical protein